MKKQLTLLSCAVIFCHSMVSAQANTSLSNLVATTSVNASLVPKTDYSFDLGKTGFNWKDLYLKGTVFINGKKIVTNTGDANDNLLFGNGAGVNLTAGVENIALGNSALNQVTSGSGNIAIGKAALFLNTATGNTVIGDQAMLNNTTGGINTAVGYKSLFSNTTASWNCAFGYQALYSNAGAGGFEGVMNNAFGYNSLRNNTSGHHNSAFGYCALFSNTSGILNTGIGANVLFSNTSGQENTAVGLNALGNNTTGSWNIGIGGQALDVNNAQSKNTAIGWSAGNGAQSAASTFVGFGAQATAVVTNSMALGTNAAVTASNQVRIGNSTVTSIGGYANWTNISDGRYKRNIKTDVPGLVFINSLKPVTYNLDIESLDSKLNPAEAKKSMINNEERIAMAAKSKVVYTGFIAQEVEVAANKIGYNFSGVDAPKDNNDLYGLRYAEFVVPLVKAVQELSKENEELKNRLDKIESMLSTKSIGGDTKINTQPIDLAGARLSQNYPNPYASNTTISYFVPTTTRNASINFYSANGSLLKSVDINTGKGSINVDRHQWASGTYSYSLFIDGKVADTKQLLLQY